MHPTRDELAGLDLGLEELHVIIDRAVELLGLEHDVVERYLLGQLRFAMGSEEVEGLEEFYVQRNLLKTQVLAEDVAEMVLFLASARSAKTTGAMIPVDGGVREAFPR